MPPQRRREEYAEATRRALLDAAREVFAADGYAAGSLDHIAQRARVTKGAVYHHFTDKEALFAAVVAELEARAVRRLDDLVDGEEDPRGRLLACLRAVLEATSDPDYARLVLGEAAALSSGRSAGPVHGRLAVVLEQLVDMGTLEPVPVALLAEILWGAAASAGGVVAQAGDSVAARRTAGALLLRLVGGLLTE